MEIRTDFLGHKKSGQKHGHEGEQQEDPVAVFFVFFCSLTGVPTSWARGAESQDPDFPSPISLSRFRFGGCTPGDCDTDRLINPPTWEGK